jgi:hypothetical protein
MSGVDVSDLARLKNDLGKLLGFDRKAIAQAVNASALSFRANYIRALSEKTEIPDLAFPRRITVIKKATAARNATEIATRIKINLRGVSASYVPPQTQYMSHATAGKYSWLGEPTRRPFVQYVWKQKTYPGVFMRRTSRSRPFDELKIDISGIGKELIDPVRQKVQAHLLEIIDDYVNNPSADSLLLRATTELERISKQQLNKMDPLGKRRSAHGYTKWMTNKGISGPQYNLWGGRASTVRNRK